MSLRCELHCHSSYSRDCDLLPEQLIRLCERQRIDVIALTDHNEVAGAVALAKIAPKWLTVIIGEEIASAEGDVIGLFLKEKIPARLSIEETIRRIREQGGLVLLPHPFDRLRHEAVGREVTEKIKGQIDFIETFNSRCVFSGDNKAAGEFASKNHLAGFVGSDAHTRSEYGRSLNLVEPFDGPGEFAARLREAQFITRRSSPAVHVTTKLVKIKKRKI